MNSTVKVKLNSIDSAKDFSKVCEKFDEDVDYVIGRYVIDAKSLLGILSTTLGKIAHVTIHSKDKNFGIADVRIKLQNEEELNVGIQFIDG